MKRIFVCSPFAGDIARNVKVAEALCRRVMRSGHAPFAPHLLYPTFTDNGISSGMRRELDRAGQLGKPIIEIAEV